MYLMWVVKIHIHLLFICLACHLQSAPAPNHGPRTVPGLPVVKSMEPHACLSSMSSDFDTTQRLACVCLCVCIYIIALILLVESFYFYAFIYSWYVVCYTQFPYDLLALCALRCIWNRYARAWKLHVYIWKLLSKPFRMWGANCTFTTLLIGHTHTHTHVYVCIQWQEVSMVHGLSEVKRIASRRLLWEIERERERKWKRDWAYKNAMQTSHSISFYWYYFIVRLNDKRTTEFGRNERVAKSEGPSELCRRKNKRKQRKSRYIT